MQRFYFENLESTDDSITIKNQTLLNQLNKVLRVRQGDEISFFNGRDNFDYVFAIVQIHKREIYLEKRGFLEIDSENHFNLNIISALPNKVEKLEYIVQKGTEIGVSNFMFFRSERSQKLNLSENKKERLKKIIIEAVEQSGRSIVPELVFIDNISLDDFSESENIFFHTSSINSSKLKDLKINKSKTINLFV